MVRFALIVVLAPATFAYAQDFYKLKANSVHRASPGPIETGQVYPLSKTGCVMAWPNEIQRSWASCGGPVLPPLGGGRIMPSQLTGRPGL
jgi:hypothetical protein